jgi:HEPN domain-containing protein
MLTTKQLRDLANARMKDVDVLFAAGRYDGASYLSGYVVELRLKARICSTLKWTGFPETKKEFEGLSSFKTHDLDVLLRLCGREAQIKKTLLAEWSIVNSWNPEARYQPVGTVSMQAAREMINAAKALTKKL